MTAKLIQTIEGVTLVTSVTYENILPAFEIRGFELIGFNNNPRQRKELQGAPIFSKLCGPMWDGDCLRYEDQSTNEILSR